MLGRSKRRRASDRITSITTSIGTGATIKGSMTGSGNCVIDGRFEGNADIDGSLILSTGAHWQGKIIAEHVIIAGTLQGDITAHLQIELLATAQVTGKLNCPRIAIAQGAVHAGQIQMNNDTEVVHFDERRAADIPTT